MLTPAYLKTVYPEFATVADDRVQIFIDNADGHFDLGRWDSFYMQGAAALVAHELALATPGLKLVGVVGASDGKTSKKVGHVQVTYSTELVVAAASNPYMRSVYGQRYLELRRLVSGGAIAV